MIIGTGEWDGRMGQENGTGECGSGGGGGGDEEDKEGKCDNHGDRRIGRLRRSKSRWWQWFC